MNLTATASPEGIREEDSETQSTMMLLSYTRNLKCKELGEGLFHTAVAPTKNKQTQTIVKKHKLGELNTN